MPPQEYCGESFSEFPGFKPSGEAKALAESDAESSARSGVERAAAEGADVEGIDVEGAVGGWADVEVMMEEAEEGRKSKRYDSKRLRTN